MSTFKNPTFSAPQAHIDPKEDEGGSFAKVPEGVKLDPPSQEERQRDRRQGQGGFRIPGIPNYPIDPALPRILYPHYINNAKTQLACMLMRPDGQSMMEGNIPKDDQHPLYRDIRSQFSEEEIELNTQREIQRQSRLNEIFSDKEVEDQRQKKRELLWNQKQTFLSMDVIKNSKNKLLKRKIRAATSPEEAQAYGIALLIKELDSDEQQTD